MDLGIAQKKYTQLVSEIGKAGLSALFPHDFEFYSVSLELTDFDGSTIEFFTFPIMPSSITKNENNRINIKKTYNAITVINSKSFTPQEISLKGNFGRVFKILIESGSPSVFRALRYSIKNGVWDANDIDQSKVSIGSNNFDPSIKTGFGCIKILQSIINKASATDDKNRFFKLYLYIPALGESYLVVPSPNPLILSQNDGNSNMIFNYTLNLIAVAPVSGNMTQGKIGSSTENLLSLSLMQKTTSTFVSTLRHAII